MEAVPVVVRVVVGAVEPEAGEDEGGGCDAADEREGDDARGRGASAGAIGGRAAAAVVAPAAVGGPDGG